MNPITRALRYGHSPNRILNFLSQMNPNLAAQISLALQSGHAAESVLDFIQRGGKKISKSLPDSGVDENPYKQTQHGIGKGAKNFGKAVLGAGAFVVGAHALSTLARSNLSQVLAPIETGLQRQIPFQGAINQIGHQPPQIPFQQGNVQPIVPPTPPNTPQTPPIGNLPVGQSPQSSGGVIGNPLPTASGNVPIAAAQQKLIGSLEAISNSPHFELFKGAIKDYPSNVVSAIAKNSIPPEELQSIEQATGKPIDQVLAEAYKEFVSTSGRKKIFGENNIGTIIPYEPSEQGLNKTVVSSQNSILTNEIEPISPQIEQKPLHLEEKEPKVPTNIKSNVVITPSGKIAEVESESKGISSVKIGDEIKRFKSDILEKPDSDMLAAVQDILSIPKEDRSAPLALTFYSPENKKLYVQFHNGKLVEYDDVDPSDFEKVSFEGGIAKTTGKNPYGEWYEGKEGSRGAAFIKFIRSVKYAKVNEGKTWRYLSQGYDYWKKLRSIPKGRKKK